MKKDVIDIVTHFDLDGIGCAMIYKWWLFNDSDDYEVNIHPVHYRNMDEQLKRITYKLDDPYKVVFTDLNLTLNQLNFFQDFPHIEMWDHHKNPDLEEIQKLSNMKKCTIYDESSCAKILFDKLGKDSFTRAQKTFIALCNDYDSWTLQFPQSEMLNIILMEGHTHHNIDRFIKDFEEGFTDIPSKYKKMVQTILDDRNQYLANMPLWEGKIQNYRVISTAVDSYINEAGDYITSKLGADIAVVVNTRSQRVSWRRKRDSDIKLNILAANITEGGGHEYAAGGNITPIFLKLIETFTPLTK